MRVSKLKGLCLRRASTRPYRFRKGWKRRRPHRVFLRPGELALTAWSAEVYYYPRLEDAWAAKEEAAGDGN